LTEAGRRGRLPDAGPAAILRSPRAWRPAVAGEAAGTAMAGKLQGKVALVTGSDSGIGRATAVTLAREGADVAVHWHSDERGGGQTAAAVRHLGVRAEVFRADLSDPAQARRLFDEVVGAFGRIDVLVNNAGKGAGADSSLDLPLEAFMDVLNVDLVSPWVLTQLAAKGMAERGGGAIVNVTSVHETIPSPGNVAYDVAKGGLRMVARTLTAELAGKGVRINNVGPGLISTPMTTERVNDAEQGAQALSQIPMGRPGEPQEIANVILFLASDDASYVSGSTFFADGGLLQHIGGA
jgi:glucose 1-dehydrogenase